MKIPKWQHLIAFAVLTSIAGVIYFSSRLWPAYTYQDYMSSLDRRQELQPSVTGLNPIQRRPAMTRRNGPIATVPVEMETNLTTNTTSEHHLEKTADLHITQEQVDYTNPNVSYAHTSDQPPSSPSYSSSKPTTLPPTGQGSLHSQPTSKPTTLPPTGQGSLHSQPTSKLTTLPPTGQKALHSQPTSKLTTSPPYRLRSRLFSKLATFPGAPSLSKLQNLSILPPSGGLHSPPCKENNCMEHLTMEDQILFRNCEYHTKMKKKFILENSKCEFVNGTGRLPVALASTEGCGNTWVRGLLEKVTGICTGFVYCDPSMRSRGYIGENIHSGSVLIVKTHTIGPRWYGVIDFNPAKEYYGSAVYILRNPHDAAIAEWNRRATNFILGKNHLPHDESHTNVIPKELFADERWDKFLHMYVDLWCKRLTKWVINETSHPVHIVRYEDLRNDTFGEVAKILQFMKMPYDEKEVKMRLDGDVEQFHRKHDDDDYEHFNPEQKEYAKAALLNVTKLAEEKHKGETLKLYEYLDYFK